MHLPVKPCLLYLALQLSPVCASGTGTNRSQLASSSPAQQSNCSQGQRDCVAQRRCRSGHAGPRTALAAPTNGRPSATFSAPGALQQLAADAASAIKAPDASSTSADTGGRVLERLQGWGGETCPDERIWGGHGPGSHKKSR
jgi:hypothetical protein